MNHVSSIDGVIAGVGSRLRRLRTQRDVTLVQLAAATGISKSTLSRLETGKRKPSLELLLPIAQAHQVPLDELVGAPPVGDPRVRPIPRERNGRIVVPLTGAPRGGHAWKVIIPPDRKAPELRRHDGHEWLYVLAGRLRLILGDHDLTLGAGEIAEFDTRTPHWFGAAEDTAVEILSLHGPYGGHMRVRASQRRPHSGADTAAALPISGKTLHRGRRAS